MCRCINPPPLRRVGKNRTKNKKTATKYQASTRTVGSKWLWADQSRGLTHTYTQTLSHTYLTHFNLLLHTLTHTNVNTRGLTHTDAHTNTHTINRTCTCRGRRISRTPCTRLACPAQPGTYQHPQHSSPVTQNYPFEAAKR